LDIFNLHNQSSPKENTPYIFDSNIWLPILGLDSEALSDHYKVFFSKIFRTDGATILICPIQLSEILNRLLRYYSRVAYNKKYGHLKGNKPDSNSFYKDEYRSSADFQAKYAEIIDDIEQYASHLKVCDITLKDLTSLTTFESQSLDFNDNYLYLLAKEHGAIIITHDGDFHDLSVQVGTYNLRLYKKHTNAIKPK